MGKAKKTILAVTACIAVAAVGAVMLGATNIGAGQNKDEAPQEVDTRVLVASSAPSRGNIVVTGEFIGTVEPDMQVTVFPKAAGEVLNINYDVGDTVEAGAVLCELDSKTLEYSIAQMQAAVSKAQTQANYAVSVAENNLATYEFNVEKGYDTTLNNARTAVEAAQKQLEVAKAGLATANANWISARTNLHHLRDNEDEVTYASDLTSQGVLGEYSYEENENGRRSAVRQAELAVTNAEIAVESAELNLEKAKETLKTVQILSKEQKHSAEIGVNQAKLSANMSDQYIAIQKLQDDLANYMVTSSIGGVVEQRNIDAYDMVSQQTPLFVISNKDAMVVSFNVSESSLAHMRVGDKLSVDKNGAVCTGKITEIASMVDAKSGLFTVKAIIENPPASLFSGSTVKVFADVQKAENDLLIPIDAIYYENGNPYVYIADNGAAKKVFVETGISDEENIQILSGITLNDEVIVTWSSSLSDGAGIKFSADEAAPSAPEPSVSGEE